MTTAATTEQPGRGPVTADAGPPSQAPASELTGAEPPAPTDRRYHPGHTTFPGLDGLRALAVLAVVTTHSAFWTGRYERGWGNNALTRLDSGVAVFFVLSGFLLVRPWLVSAHARSEAPSVRVYAVRRVARIMPAYLVAVVLAMTLLSDNRTATWGDWVRHLFLLQIYHFGWMRGGLTQTWSLCTEAAFYVVLPVLGWVLMRAMRRRWRPGLLVGALLLLVAAPLPWYLFLYNVRGSFWVSAGLWLPGFVGWFAGGMIMAVIRVHLDHGEVPSTSRWWLAEELGRHPFTCWAVAAVTFFAALAPIAGPRSLVASTIAQSVTKQTLYVLMAVALTWPAVFGRSPVTEAVLGNPVMRYAGDISYGVFLYHLVILDGVMHLLGNAMWTGRVVEVLPLTLAGSGLVAALSFRFLERPLIRRAHRVRGRRPAPAAPAGTGDDAAVAATTG